MKYLLIIAFIFGAFLGNIARRQYEKQIMDYERITPGKYEGKFASSVGETIKKEKNYQEKLDAPRMARKMGDPKISGESVMTLTIKKYFGKDWQTAIAIAKAESHNEHTLLNCEALGDGGNSFGLFQVHLPSHPEYASLNLFDCGTNIKVASEIFTERGNFTAWSTYNDGTYLAFMGTD